MSSPDEFDYGDQLDSGLAPRLVAGIVVALFLLCTFGGGVADLFFPVEALKVFGQEAEKKQAKSDRATFKNGSLARLFENNLRDHSRTRSWVLPTYSYLKFAYLNEVPEGLIAGKDHWVFLKNRTLVSERNEADMAQALTNVMVALDRRLSGNGIDFLCMPIPRKSYIARDFLPDGVDTRPELDDHFLDDMIARGVHTVDLRASLKEIGPASAYFKLDSHWKPTSALMAAELIAKQTGLLKPEAQRMGKISSPKPLQLRANFYDGLLAMDIDPNRNDFDAIDLPMVVLPKVVGIPRYEELYKKPRPVLPVAYSGTSFSVITEIVKLASHFAGQPIYNGALSARPLMDTLARTLEAYAKAPGTLKTLVFETPIAPAFGFFTNGLPRFPPTVSKALAALPPQHLIQLGPTAPSWLPLKPGPMAKLTVNRLIEVPPGIFSQSGDGVIGLHVKGAQTGQWIRLTVNCDKAVYNYFVRTPEFDFTLPIVSQGPGSHKIMVAIQGAANTELRLEEIGIVHQPASAEATPLQWHRTTATTELSSDQELRLGHRAAILIRTTSTVRIRADVTMRIHVKGGSEPRDVLFTGFKAGGIFVVDLGHEQGQLLTKVELLGLDPETTIKSATITGAHR